MGYPLIVNDNTGELISLHELEILAFHPTQRTIDLENGGNALESHIGQDYTIQSHGFAMTVKLIKLSYIKQKEELYEWWTWNPSLEYLAVVLGFIGFVSALVYLIPMCAGWPLAQNGRASVSIAVFFVDVLQVIPYICIAVMGYMYTVEAAGSWWKPKLDYIGYWACLFNFIGTFGFLMCGALAIPVTLGSNCCTNIAKWGSTFVCFWGSVSYFVGGILQWIEFANPEPIVFGNKHKNE